MKRKSNRAFPVKPIILSPSASSSITRKTADGSHYLLEMRKPLMTSAEELAYLALGNVGTSW